MSVRITSYKRIIILLVCFITSIHSAKGQCSSFIGSFPYSEGFETSDGGWFAGGTSSGWAWGTPLKPVITTAASGTKCWVTATLTQSLYNNNENSTLTSPCFDFTSLTAPYIKFNVFWETENKYDGASFQYSIDGGNNWTTLGSYADYVACPANNWFNTSTTITALGSDGWSGNIQPTASCTGGAGNGSGEWRFAQHEMTSLAGRSSVRFRFRFAAGSICNNYDGFAIDDIWIGEATPLSPDFSYTCGNNNTVTFTAATSACSVLFDWNFGDPASGINNTSALANPTHVFPGPGVYNVTLAIQYGVSPPPQMTKPVNIITASAGIVNSIRCNGDKNGSLIANVSTAGTYTYQWSTNPQQTTMTASGVGAGTYSVTVSSLQTCPVTASVTLAQPSKLNHQLITADPLCGFSNGSASIQPTGGTQPYKYTWTPSVTTASSSNTLAPGAYRIIVSDNNNCADTATFTLVNQNPLKVFLGNDTLICPGQQVILNPGTYNSYLWQDNSSLPVFTVTQTGDYSVTVGDNNGCVASDTINITVDCSDLFFPTAFTPNNDSKNELFGPLGNLAAVSKYTLSIYNRWGQPVFYSNDPFQKWDGRLMGKLNDTNLFVWYAEYVLPGMGKQLRKGTILLIK
jgi:gliding motility-associated-like protein